MGKQKTNQRKKQTAVTFDEEDRNQYLKSMFGAKKRRKEFYQKKVEQ